jgi:subtilase family serine protease
MHISLFQNSAIGVGSLSLSASLVSGESKGEIVILRPSRFLFTLAMLVSFTAINSQAQLSTLFTHHVREATQNGEARFLGHFSSAEPMRLVLVLPLRNQSELDTFLSDLYDPSSPSYHQFLTVEEFTAKFGPTQDDYDAVVNFAQRNGLTVVATSRNRLNIDVTGPVLAIEKALHITLGLYMHPTEGRTFYAPDREPTPDVSVQLWHISGLDNYSIPQPAGLHRNTSGVKSHATTGSGPSASFLGSDMRAAYYGGTLTGAGQSLGLLEYYGTDLADLNTYFKNAGQTNNVPITVLSTDGTSTSCLYTQGCDDTEQTLDMTQGLGMAPGLTSLVMYVGSTDSAIFNAMATASPLNAQLSSSWTWSPADPNTDNPYFEEFAAQGQNLFQAAGDSGAWTSHSTIFPADDVYLTSVGGTDLSTSGAGGAWSSESAWVDGGGGISPDKYAIPSWQTAAASSCSSCSKTYRNAPDVSANANFTFYVCADQTACTANEYGGTSFAAPMWAGYLALVNQQSVANSGKTLGFINPSLYSIGAGTSYSTSFHDIVSGSDGYSATTGYDLATGWGSPKGSGLLNALLGTSTTSGFTVSASPTSLTVVQGNSGTSTITSTVSGGFDSAVTLSAAGQPSGVTVSFSPTSITGTGTSTATFTVASSTATGTYTITISGISGSTTSTATVSLTVTSSTAGFSISANPSSITVDRRSSGTVTITSTVSGGFDSAVSLSASGLPSGVTASFSPNSITGSGTSTMTITASRRATTGTATINITGSSGTISHSATVSVDVVSAAIR